ncbi:hypothetical protein BC939DRAFT_129371 [Gamsiella multidivaricata]|uniref:uncharacterized protein n=1 Tax=Gamsiella multidivaricata TaxID=101098 RepID=UPI00221E97C7|nr:uncharacterized protein BC939DRAFT_129371 [Gamsiella multidivaricata]KAI7825385.1 hypothetical protein BC939DRAFT_129371 [Gamsiella multidivaricata]
MDAITQTQTRTQHNIGAVLEHANSLPSSTLGLPVTRRQMTPSKCCKKNRDRIIQPSCSIASDKSPAPFFLRLALPKGAGTCWLSWLMPTLLVSLCSFFPWPLFLSFLFLVFHTFASLVIVQKSHFILSYILIMHLSFFALSLFICPALPCTLHTCFHSSVPSFFLSYIYSPLITQHASCPFSYTHPTLLFLKQNK